MIFVYTKSSRKSLGVLFEQVLIGTGNKLDTVYY